NFLLQNKLVEEYFLPQVAETGHQASMLALLLESEAHAEAALARLDAGEDFGELAGELSRNMLTESSNGEVGHHIKDIVDKKLSTPVPGDWAFGAAAGTLSPPLYDPDVDKWVGYWIIKVLTIDETGDQAHVNVILTGTLEEAEAVIQRLDAGEDFAALAGEVSRHDTSRENGGDLGNVEAGSLTAAMEEYIFDNPEMELGRHSAPIEDVTMTTKGGYWLVEVLANEPDSQISEEDRMSMKDELFGEWLGALQNDPAYVIDHSYLDAERITWAISKVD
ncbi:peptidylprolyl isomerase, partial [Chloroflexota bacterium]